MNTYLTTKNDDVDLGQDIPPIEQKEHKFGFFEKFLAIWITICMGIGILFSVYWPKFGETLNTWNLFDGWRGGIGINIPIGMMLAAILVSA